MYLKLGKIRPLSFAHPCGELPEQSAILKLDLT
jgi:hypothetical protein